MKRGVLIVLLVACGIGGRVQGQEDVYRYTLGDMIQSAEHGYIDQVEKALRQGLDINAFDPHNYKSALIGAIMNHKKEMVLYLLENGADPNRINEAGLGASEAAADETVIDFMDTMIVYGADLSEVSVNSCQAIYRAASSCRGDNQSYQKRLRRILGMGARQVLLSEYFPKYVGEDKREKTPLMVASRCNSLEVVKLLWANGGSLTAKDIKGDTALHYSYKSSNPKIMEFLLKVGADVNALNDNKSSTLHYAAMRGDIMRVQLLVRYGASVDMKNSFGGTPIIRAVIGSDSGKKYLDVIQFLIKSGADVNSRQNDGMTPLMSAAHFRDTPVEVAKLLVRHGAKLELRDNAGKTALEHALESGNVGVAKWLRLFSGKRAGR